MNIPYLWDISFFKHQGRFYFIGYNYVVHVSRNAITVSLPSCKIIGLVDCLPCKGPD